MDQQRRKVIVQEIEYWHKSKLLPDHYCDFLLNLYAEQDEQAKPSTHLSGRAAEAARSASGKQWLFSISFFFLDLLRCTSF